METERGQAGALARLRGRDTHLNDGMETVYGIMRGLRCFPPLTALGLDLWKWSGFLPLGATDFAWVFILICLGYISIDDGVHLMCSSPSFLEIKGSKLFQLESRETCTLVCSLRRTSDSGHL